MQNGLVPEQAEFRKSGKPFMCRIQGLGLFASRCCGNRSSRAGNSEGERKKKTKKKKKKKNASEKKEARPEELDLGVAETMATKLNTMMRRCGALEAS